MSKHEQHISIGHAGHAHADSAPASLGQSPAYRRALWIALIVNAAMFFVEIIFSNISGSVSLLADAIDFFGDAANYALSLWVLASVLATRAKLALCKGGVMLWYGVFVLLKTLWAAYQGSVPEAALMGTIGLIALAANVGVAWLLYAYREGDANMRAVWLCTRNDALANIAIVLAALGVFGTASRWPDLGVALFMAGLAMSSGVQVIRRARQELKTGVASGAGHGHDHAH